MPIDPTVVTALEKVEDHARAIREALSGLPPDLVIPIHVPPGTVFPGSDLVSRTCPSLPMNMCNIPPMTRPAGDEVLHASDLVNALKDLENYLAAIRGRVAGA